MADLKNGNGQKGRDLVLGLHSEVKELSAALERHVAETKQLIDRNHAETQHYLGRMARIILGIGDHLNDHDERLIAVEAKVL